MKKYAAGLFAISEIFAVLIAGLVLGGLTSEAVLGGLGFDLSTLDETEILANPTLDGALISAVIITSRFFWLLLFAFLILRFVHKTKPKEVGVSRGGHSWGKLIGAGVLLFAIGSLPFKLVLLSNEFLHFGQGIEAWKYFSGQEFTLAFVLLTLASGILLPPLFEEPFARGYMRARLAKVFTPIGGVILAAVFFMGSHGHFYEPDAVVLLSFFFLIYGAITWTWITYRMGSIVPAFVAHSLTNFPAPIEKVYLIPTVIAMVALCIYGMKYLKREFRDFFGELKACPKAPLVYGLAVIAALLATIILVRELVMILGILAVILMIVGWLPPVKRWVADKT